MAKDNGRKAEMVARRSTFINEEGGQTGGTRGKPEGRLYEIILHIFLACLWSSPPEVSGRSRKSLRKNGALIWAAVKFKQLIALRDRYSVDPIDISAVHSTESGTMIQNIAKVLFGWLFMVTHGGEQRSGAAPGLQVQCGMIILLRVVTHFSEVSITS